MKLTRLTMVLFLVASLSLFAACDSDDGDGGGSSGSDVTADTAADVTGETGDDTADDTTADTGDDTAAETTPAGGKCENEADLAILADEAVDANNTSKDCLLGPCGPEQECIAGCIAVGEAAVEGIGISAECADCFAGSTICGYENCLALCVADATSEGCLTCMGEHCIADFCACAGASLSEGCATE